MHCLEANVCSTLVMNVMNCGTKLQTFDIPLHIGSNEEFSKD